jgi:RNA polymerase sigma factor (sigma-70 family)
MKASLTLNSAMTEQDKSITEVISRERARLRNFIRQRVADPGDAEDILQDVFYELVAASRLMEPIEQVGAWLFRVARNRITDLFRKRRPQQLREYGAAGDGEEDADTLEDLLPSPDAGPEAAYSRSVLLQELIVALEEIPPEQREAFLGHEIDGHSFAEMSAASGVSVNTLLARKRYAVLHLRRRLQAIHEEFSQPKG